MPNLKNKLVEKMKAPDFNLPASNGKNVTLEEFNGKKNVVIYFYPKDDTPGCTIEACGFRDSKNKIDKINAIIIGVSPDSIKKHQRFIEKYSLPFLLVSDEEKTMCEVYGVWVEKNMYGRRYMGVARTTFVIDKSGKISKIFKKVKPRGHDEEVLKYLKSM